MNTADTPSGPGGRGWIIAVAAIISAILPAMEFIQGCWDKDREMAISQAQYKQDTQRVWIQMVVNQELPERAKQRVLRFLQKSLDDEAMKKWAAEELEIVSNTIEEAEKERDEARAEANKAKERAAEAQVRAEEAEREKAALEAQLREAQSETEAPKPELTEQLAAAQRKILEAKQDIAASRAIEQYAIQTATGIESQLSASGKQVVAALGAGTRPARVFFHIRSEDQRPWAQSLAGILIENGAVVPKIERLDFGPSRTELRFYREKERREVETMVRVARQHGLNITLRYIPGREEDPRIRPRTYELWLAPSD